MRSQSSLDFAIVGAGLTGLTFAWDLANHNSHLEIEVFEKSKGCGGRMATRRTDSSKFDHGAQFIKRADVSEKWIEIWQQAGIIQQFPAYLGERFYGKSGMTDLAKALTGRTKVTYNEKIVSVRREGSCWFLKNDKDVEKMAKNVVITSPLPQSLDILNTSGLAFNPDLLNIEYSCALVLLIEADNRFLPELLYAEGLGEGIFSVCDQHAKGNSKVPAWTFVMDPLWSRKYFDSMDSEIREEASKIFVRRIPDLAVSRLQIKKWRYSQPLTVWPSPFVSPAPNLYLAGDSFGGPSLLGALRSSQGLFNYVKGL